MSELLCTEPLAYRLLVLLLSEDWGWAWTLRALPGILSFTRFTLCSGELSPHPLLGQARSALTDVIKASWCQPLRQVGGKEEASEQRAEEVVAVAGAQCLLPTAVAPAPAQSELAKEKQG